MRKVYLAASFSWQAKVREYATQLERLGYIVTSQWLDQKSSFTTPDNRTIASEQTWSECQRLSVRDISNIFEADTLVLFENGQAIERNTRVAEFGGALFTGRQCIVIKPPEEDKKNVVSNIFIKLEHIPDQWLLDYEMGKVKPVIQFNSWEDFIADITDPVEVEVCSGCGRDAYDPLCGCPAGVSFVYQAKSGLSVLPPLPSPK